MDGGRGLVARPWLTMPRGGMQQVTSSRGRRPDFPTGRNVTARSVVRRRDNRCNDGALTERAARISSRNPKRFRRESCSTSSRRRRGDRSSNGKTCGPLDRLMSTQASLRAGRHRVVNKVEEHKRPHWPDRHMHRLISSDERLYFLIVMPAPWALVMHHYCWIRARIFCHDGARPCAAPALRARLPREGAGAWNARPIGA